MKNPAKTRRHQWLLVCVGLLSVWLIVSLGTYRIWIKGADHRDFYPLWAGARTVLEGSKDLYSVDTMERMQIRLYGNKIPEGRDQQGFAYPAILLPFLLPFSLIPDVEVATAIWEGFTVVLLIITFMILQDLKGEISGIPVLLLLVWFYPLLMVFQGQITGFLLAAMGVGYWIYRNKSKFTAGLIMSIGLIKPELTALPILILLFFEFRKRRFRFAWGVGLGILIMFVMSITLVGWWVGGWFEAIIRYSRYAQVVLPVQYFWAINPILGVGILTLIIGAVLRVIEDEEGFFSAAFPIQLLIFPQTPIWGLTVVCLPLILAWNDRKFLGFTGVWLLGWLLVFGSFHSEWWKFQILAISLATLLLVAFRTGHGRVGNLNPAAS
jgi:hypothetical protein